jgi:phosphate uptake regulator
MRATFHAELDELMTDLARMVRLAAQMMTNASIALHQSDSALAGLVIADRDR